jgi:hypothetical protein
VGLEVGVAVAVGVKVAVKLGTGEGDGEIVGVEVKVGLLVPAVVFETCKLNSAGSPGVQADTSWKITTIKMGNKLRITFLFPAACLP